MDWVNIGGRWGWGVERLLGEIDFYTGGRLTINEEHRDSLDKFPILCSFLFRLDSVRDFDVSRESVDFPHWRYRVYTTSPDN